jgi:hypothetical protein
MRIPPPPAPRKRPDSPIRVESYPETMEEPRFLGYVGNVSRTGAFLQCSAPRPVGSVLRVRLHLKNAPAESLCCDAQVIWSRGYGGRSGLPPGMGIRFLGVEAEIEDLLQRLCD